MEKYIFFAFRGDPLCFIHVLLNSLDMASNGMEGKIILEGEAVQLIAAMAEPDHFLHALYDKAKKRNLFIGACRACSVKLEAADAIKKENIALIGDMAGHPSMSSYIEKGYKILTF